MFQKTERKCRSQSFHNYRSPDNLPCIWEKLWVRRSASTWGRYSEMHYYYLYGNVRSALHLQCHKGYWRLVSECKESLVTYWWIYYSKCQCVSPKCRERNGNTRGRALRPVSEGNCHGIKDNDSVCIYKDVYCICVRIYIHVFFSKLCCFHLDVFVFVLVCCFLLLCKSLVSCWKCFSNEVHC